MKPSLALLLASSLLAVPSLHAANGTWTLDGDGLWTAAANWSGDSIADGADSTAFFTADLTTASRIVTLNGDRTIGNITFTDDTTSSTDLSITEGILTLDVVSGAPTVNVTQSDRTLTIASQITGTKGLTKSGNGILALTNANTYSGITTLQPSTAARSTTPAAPPSPWLRPREPAPLPAVRRLPSAAISPSARQAAPVRTTSTSAPGRSPTQATARSRSTEPAPPSPRAASSSAASRASSKILRPFHPMAASHPIEPRP